jgi:hypothetical protein
MRALLRTTAIAVSFAALPPAAEAQQAYDKRINHWRIASAGAHCLAANRPFHDLNASPFNGLSINLTKDGRWTFWVYFWPKALKTDADVPLVFTFGGRKDVKALGKAFADMAATLSNVGASFRDDFAKAEKGELIVAAEGLTTQLHFDIADIAAVFAALEACAKTLR